MFFIAAITMLSHLKGVGVGLPCSRAHGKEGRNVPLSFDHPSQRANRVVNKFGDLKLRSYYLGFIRLERPSPKEKRGCAEGVPLHKMGWCLITRRRVAFWRSGVQQVVNLGHAYCDRSGWILIVFDQGASFQRTRQRLLVRMDW